MPRVNPFKRKPYLIARVTVGTEVGTRNTHVVPLSREYDGAAFCDLETGELYEHDRDSMFPNQFRLYELVLLEEFDTYEEVMKAWEAY